MKIHPFAYLEPPFSAAAVETILGSLQLLALPHNNYFLLGRWVALKEKLISGYLSVLLVCFSTVGHLFHEEEVQRKREKFKHVRLREMVL